MDKLSQTKILQAKMDRRQFLGYMGAAALVVTGVSGIVGGLSRIGGRKASAGYGASSYGGGKTGVQTAVKPGRTL